MTALCLSSGCKSDADSGDQAEGIIEFQTRALDETHPLFGFAPDNATLKFKGDLFAIEMSTMGMFNMAIIGDNSKQTMAQTVKFMNIKQASIDSAQQLMQDNKDYELKLEETGETKQILTFNCYKVRATKVKDPSVTFDVWYTKDLGMENCNALTPYASIKGMLLDYRIKKFGMEMHFLAKSHKAVKVEDKTFEIPESMSIVSRDEMQRFFEELQ